MILVYMEQYDGVLEDVSLEMLSKGRELADQMNWTLAGFLMGTGLQELAPVVVAHGADLVLVVEHALLSQFTIEAFAIAAHQVILEYKPSVCFFGATPNARDLAGRLAVRLRTGLNADCSDLHMSLDTGTLVSEVSGFGGGVLALIEMQHHRPQMATVRPGVFTVRKPDHKYPGKVVPFHAEIEPEMIHTRIIKRVIGEQLNLAQSPIIIAGGRGIEGDFRELQRVADLLGGEYGATRPPVDDGYIERERQIGQTGVVCRPKIALCCGISGAFHFVVGIEKAETIISINTDPEAPIFEHSDYCLVADVEEILPELIKSLAGDNMVRA
jgi:electron transfer flavoprotein alpha subunit